MGWGWRGANSELLAGSTRFQAMSSDRCVTGYLQGWTMSFAQQTLVVHLLSPGLTMANPGIFISFEFFGPGLGPGTRPDASGSPRYRWARAQSRIWSRFCRKSGLFVQNQVSKRYLPAFQAFIHEYLSVNASTSPGHRHASVSDACL